MKCGDDIMYGSNELNNHYILRYGLTIDFYQSFRSLKYLDIELPSVLFRKFQTYIRLFVDNNLAKSAYINKLQQKHQIKTMEDVQRKLVSLQGVKRISPAHSHSKTILMSGVFARFALEQFPNEKIILYYTNTKEKAAIAQAFAEKSYKGNISIVNLLAAQKRSAIPKNEEVRLNRELTKILLANRRHEIFGTLKFKKWLIKNIFEAIKWIHTLDEFIRKNFVGLILDQYEITYPSNVLSLLSTKYNLPFLLAPQLLIADRTLIPTRAKHYFVWGSNYKDWLIKRGIESAKIFITGNLRFEYEKQLKPMEKAKFIQRLGIPNDHLIITFTSQNFPRQVNSAILEWVKKATESLPITVIIKPHPADYVDYSPYLKEVKVLLAPKEMKLYNILENSDLNMTISSNTAIEAAYLKKGVIILQPQIPYLFEQNSNDFNSFLVRSNAGLVAHNAEELTKHFKMLVNNSTFRKNEIKKAQIFLEKTLETKQSTSLLTKKIIQEIIEEGKNNND